MRLDTYILDDDGNPVAEPDRERFDTWMAYPPNRTIRYDDLPDGVSVSTVFLGFDPRLSERGPPVLWETMIFGGPRDLYRPRYSSSGAACQGHAAAVALAKAASHKE